MKTYLNNKAIQHILEETEKLDIEIKHPGKFTDWCKSHGFEGVTCDCICKAMSSNDPKLHKEANFAYNFGFKKNGKTCDCMAKK